LKFENCLGALDGCQVKIKKLSNSNIPCPDLFWCERKHAYTTNVMAVCDADLCFTYLDIGKPGKHHDAHIFAECALGRKMIECPGSLFPPDTFLVADNAFPLLPNLLKPFRNNGRLSADQKHFNKRLSKARNVVERAFGLLKMRFRRLDHLYMKKLENICNLIETCCILHNVIIIDK
jgi:transposase